MRNELVAGCGGEALLPHARNVHAWLAAGGALCLYSQACASVHYFADLLRPSPPHAPSSPSFLRPQVDYKRPMPSNSDVICTARVEKIEGRKVRRAGRHTACDPCWRGVLMAVAWRFTSRSLYRSPLLFEQASPLRRTHPMQIWTVAEVADRPGGAVYATGRALYVTPRSQAEKQEQKQ